MSSKNVSPFALVKHCLSINFCLIHICTFSKTLPSKFCLSSTILCRGQTFKHCLRSKFQMFDKQCQSVWPCPPLILNERRNDNETKSFTSSIYDSRCTFIMAGVSFAKSFCIFLLDLQKHKNSSLCSHFILTFTLVEKVRIQMPLSKIFDVETIVCLRATRPILTWPNR